MRRKQAYINYNHKNNFIKLVGHMENRYKAYWTPCCEFYYIIGENIMLLYSYWLKHIPQQELELLYTSFPPALLFYSWITRFVGCFASLFLQPQYCFILWSVRMSFLFYKTYFLLPYIILFIYLFFNRDKIKIVPINFI